MKCRTIIFWTLCMAAAAGCSRPPSLTSEVELTMNPSGRTALAGVLNFTTDQPARVTLTISDSENTSTITPSDTYETEHEVMVLGLRPGRTNTVDINYENENGELGPLAQKIVETDPLSDEYPPIDVILSRPARMEPGVTYIP